MEAAVASMKLYYTERSIVPPEELEMVLGLEEQAAVCPHVLLRIIGQHSDDVWAKE